MLISLPHGQTEIETKTGRQKTRLPKNKYVSTFFLWSFGVFCIWWCLHWQQMNLLFINRLAQFNVTVWHIIKSVLATAVYSHSEWI